MLLLMVFLRVLCITVTLITESVNLFIPFASLAHPIITSPPGLLWFVFCVYHSIYFGLVRFHKSNMASGICPFLDGISLSLVASRSMHIVEKGKNLTLFAAE